MFRQTVLSQHGAKLSQSAGVGAWQLSDGVTQAVRAYKHAYQVLLVHRFFIQFAYLNGVLRSTTFSLQLDLEVSCPPKSGSVHLEEKRTRNKKIKMGSS